MCYSLSIDTPRKQYDNYDCSWIDVVRRTNNNEKFDEGEKEKNTRKSYYKSHLLLVNTDDRFELLLIIPIHFAVFTIISLGAKIFLSSPFP